MKTKKPVKYWLAKYLIMHYLSSSFSEQWGASFIPAEIIWKWFDPESRHFKGICFDPETVKRKWREVRRDHKLAVDPWEDGCFYPFLNLRTYTWDLPKEFISWLKEYVKRWER